MWLMQSTPQVARHNFPGGVYPVPVHECVRAKPLSNEVELLASIYPASSGALSTNYVGNEAGYFPEEDHGLLIPTLLASLMPPIPL